MSILKLGKSGIRCGSPVRICFNRIKSLKMNYPLKAGCGVLYSHLYVDLTLNGICQERDHICNDRIIAVVGVIQFQGNSARKTEPATCSSDDRASDGTYDHVSRLFPHSSLVRGRQESDAARAQNSVDTSIECA